MTMEERNRIQVVFRKLNQNDFDSLCDYLHKLSHETKKRFGPHSFDKQAIRDYYTHEENLIGYIGIDIQTNEIIAYSLIKIGYLEHDSFRLQSYGMILNNKTDCTFAPSVADDWQGCGVGNKMFHFILSELKNLHVKRIILWGGVQMDNHNAVSYYKRNDFKILGQFTYNGENYDMAFDID